MKKATWACGVVGLSWLVWGLGCGSDSSDGGGGAGAAAAGAGGGTAAGGSSATAGAAGAAGGGAGSGGATGGPLSSGACFQCASGACATEVSACSADGECKVYLDCIRACPASPDDPLAPEATCFAKCVAPSGAPGKSALGALGKCLDATDNDGGACVTACAK